MIKHKRALQGALALAVAAGATATATAAGSAAAASAHAGDEARLRAILQRLTTVDGGPGALVEVRNRRGSSVLTSGVADVRSHAPVPRDSRFRIGSMTKSFTATLVLQQVAKRRVALDAPVERYLPGVVRGPGGDGRKITVRHLLQQTSGLPDYLSYIKPQDVLKNPLVHYEARDLLKTALAHEPTFEEPGKGWSYSNTNYLLAGMLIEKVTRNTYGEEVKKRIIKPLNLSETSVPGDKTTIPGPHPRGYARPGKDAPLIDVTAVNPTIGGSAGGIISSGTDLNKFFGALVGASCCTGPSCGR
ncbi:serine hydrolase domain-containing protein [Actinomadura yumaensis]|uniref:serine hydrolase domain-containing protein n=1 Tax=Actinomadura yumaensis TaxID=111807 RepID=UPI003619159B